MHNQVPQGQGSRAVQRRATKTQCGYIAISLTGTSVFSLLWAAGGIFAAIAGASWHSKNTKPPGVAQKIGGQIVPDSQTVNVKDKNLLVENNFFAFVLFLKFKPTNSELQKFSP